MAVVNPEKIQETSWSGNNIDNQIKTNITAIKNNCEKLSETIKEIITYRRKLSKREPIGKNSLQMTEEEQQIYLFKYNPIYETWEGLNGLSKILPSLSAIKNEIGILETLLEQNSAQFSALELTAENLEAGYNKILREASAAGINIGSIMLHETNAPQRSGESGDRTLNEDYSGIKEENYYLYEGLDAGEYLYLKAGTGLEAGTFFIMKHTKDGREVAMKNISKETADDWIRKSETAINKKNHLPKEEELAKEGEIKADSEVHNYDYAKDQAKQIKAKEGEIKADSEVHNYDYAKEQAKEINDVQSQKTPPEEAPPEKVVDNLKKQTEQLQEDVDKIRNPEPLTGKEVVDNLKNQTEQLQEDVDKIRNPKPLTKEEVIDNLKRQTEQLKTDASNKNQQEGLSTQTPKKSPPPPTNTTRLGATTGDGEQITDTVKSTETAPKKNPEGESIIKTLEVQNEDLNKQASEFKKNSLNGTSSDDLATNIADNFNNIFNN